MKISGNSPVAIYCLGVSLPLVDISVNGASVLNLGGIAALTIAALVVVKRRFTAESTARESIGSPSSEDDTVGLNGFVRSVAIGVCIFVLIMAVSLSVIFGPYLLGSP